MSKELTFNSSLSDAEIDRNFENVDFFDDHMAGLREDAAYEQGEATTQAIARKRSLPSVDVVATRMSLQMTQKRFASLLGVSTRTVESWECGRSTPTPTAKKLIFLIANDHSLAQRLE